MCVFLLFSSFESRCIFSPTIRIAYELDQDVRMKDCLDGQLGKIYHAEWISNDNHSPIVLLKFENVLSEYELLFYNSRYSHQHLVHSYGFVQSKMPSFLLLQERAPYGDLQMLLKKNEFRPSTSVLVRIFTQIIEAMIYITSQNLVHGDLRCANVLVFEKNDFNPDGNLVKLKNFALTCPNDPIRKTTRRLTIPVRYCALEILRSAGQANYSELSDVYSMGVLMWEACSRGERPYASLQLNSEVRQRKLNRETLVKPSSCDQRLWSIIEDCWHNKPNLRYKFSDMKTRLSQIPAKYFFLFFHSSTARHSSRLDPMSIILSN